MERNSHDRSWTVQRIATPLRAGIPVLLCALVILIASTPSRFDPQDDVEASKRSRAAFGFASDDAAHEAALASDAAGESLDKYGMALTREELAEMNRRTDVALRAAPVEGALRLEAPDSFAALYVDHADEGAVVVLATHPSEIDSGKVAELAGGRPFAIRRVDRSARQLRSDFEALQALAGELRRGGETGLSGLRLDEIDNTIRVVVQDGAAQERVASILAARGMPSYVELEEGGVVPETAVRGGDALTSCSAGPQVWRDTAYGRFYFTLTAKHCPNSQQHKTAGHDCAQHDLRHDAAGQPHQTGIGPVLFADVQLHWAGTTNGYVGPGTDRPVIDESHLYGWGYADTLGMPVCKRGKTTGTTCGTLQNKRMYFWVDELGAWLDEQRGVNLSSDGGDSGGVYYMPNPAGGVTVLGGHFGRYGGLAAYSHIWFMHQELDEQGYSFAVQKWWE